MKRACLFKQNLQYIFNNLNRDECDFSEEFREVTYYPNRKDLRDLEHYIENSYDVMGDDISEDVKSMIEYLSLNINKGNHCDEFQCEHKREQEIVYCRSINSEDHFNRELTIKLTLNLLRIYGLIDTI